MTEISEDDFDTETPSEDQLASISALVEKASELANEIEMVENHLELLKKEHAQIVERELVSRLINARTRPFEMDDGRKVAIESALYASEVKDQEKKIELMRRRADWLVAQGKDGEALVQEAIELRFDKGQHEKCEAIQAVLKEAGATYAKFDSIHTGSLKSFIDKVMETGDEVPLQDLGFYQKTHAVITVPGQEKKKSRRK